MKKMLIGTILMLAAMTAKADNSVAIQNGCKGLGDLAVLVDIDKANGISEKAEKEQMAKLAVEHNNDDKIQLLVDMVHVIYVTDTRGVSSRQVGNLMQDYCIKKFTDLKQ